MVSCCRYAANRCRYCAYGSTAWLPAPKKLTYQTFSRPISAGTLRGQLGLGEVPVDGVEAGQEVGEVLRPDGHGHRGADGRVDRVAAAHPVPEAERVRRVDAEGRDLVQRGRHGDEVLGHRRRPPPRRRPRSPRTPRSASSSQARASRALVRVSRVVKVLDATMNSVVSGSRSPGLLGHVGRVDVGDEPAAQPGLDVRLQRLVDHHRAEVGTADADVDDGLDPLAGDPGPLAAAHLVGEGVHLVQHLVHLRRPRRRRRPPGWRPRGSRSAVCSTARSSVTLMCSPANMASRRSASADLLGQLDQGGQDLGRRSGSWTGRRTGRRR